MPPRPQRRICLVCQHQDSKYTCASCRASYCSVACYKQHKETCSSGAVDAAPRPDPNPNPGPTSTSEPETDATDDQRPPTERLQDPPHLRPLTALKWPYVPDTSAYPDPLKRDDPKPLQLPQYEAIATSSAIRALLRSNPRLCDLLTSVDKLRGADREEALQRALGVDSHLLKNDDLGRPLDEDTRAFRELAEAVEDAVRGGREDALGLDWD